ncbi:AAA family ATPase [Candidatus Oscillochloris fontis]|uniref:AAA family ATPase n=1 Tax=Candidatus Oscillochloris fontis TaxID=2496868 RepID=UPI00101CA979|nr:AAA family ATPase [Candidatus Oscillochloris fontis]
MAKQRKKEPEIDMSQVLTVSALDGRLQHTFAPDVIQSFRYMATHLTLNNELPARIALIAALRGEGVTHTAVALGATIASDTGRRICVVELNWWAPGMINLLDPRRVDLTLAKKKKKAAVEAIEPLLPDHPRIEHVLAGEADLDAAIIHTNIPTLDLLPAGDIPISRRPATARSASLRDLIARLTEQYDHLLLDVPALRTTSDAIVLAALSSACIVVTQQGTTSITPVQQALDDVKSLTMLGIVLNKVRIHMPNWIQSLVPQD